MTSLRATLFPVLACALLWATPGCSLAADAGPFKDVYVLDFQSDAPTSCTNADVDVDNARAAAFFGRAKKVDYRAIHDYYDTLPCRAVGTLRWRGQRCEWELNAGLYARLSCGRAVRYYACDSCQDLLTPPAR